MAMYPAFFMSHGVPHLVTELNAFTKFLGYLGARLPRPKGIVLFSSQWTSSVQKVTGAPQLATLKDDWGLPEELSAFEYPAQGSIVLAHDVQRLLASDGMGCEIDDGRGLDYGGWTVLSLMYPAANIPVITASINPRSVPEDSYRIGKALNELRKNNYMIIGSGGTVRNLRKMNWSHGKAERWAVRFDRWLDEKIQIWDLESLYDYESRAPYAQDAVPGREHLLPLFVSMGACDGSRKAKLLHQQYHYGTLSLNCWMLS
ncbi:4,5-DOPA dioxygenase extradiol [Paenibacillus solanacearum]|uniref:4,5-DOPA dioxygenase extradiol n=1 Tax=Paenibacillus solanacearum TaxID=2048548 RepID=A0A916K4M5_9BACL|nr:class III extradiol ring-cleavage dioxygenase [Paenibacillus solanacearum]CAG7644091.1 4,5-DOPA dioxygenase extradiol [Paenibacillus solanacearum]